MNTHRPQNCPNSPSRNRFHRLAMVQIARSGLSTLTFIILIVVCPSGCSIFRLFQKVTPVPPVVLVEISREISAAILRSDADIVVRTQDSPSEQIGIIRARRIGLITAVSGKLLIDGTATGVSVIIAESPGKDFIFVNDCRYRGQIEIRASTYSMQIINILDIEQYLYGVVPREMSASWPEEALKAQAIAARTYAIYQLLHRKYGGYDLKSTVESQVYGGASAETVQTNEAVDATRDLVMAFGDELVAAYFHSTCGGKTENDGALWGGTDLPYLKSRRCGYCEQSPHFSWQTEQNRKELTYKFRNANNDIGNVYWINTSKTDTGRVKNITIKGTKMKIRLTEAEFRTIWGDDLIKSRFYRIKNRFGGIVIEGHGWGHGVGMCQWGARGMAELGNNYRQILKRYYGGWIFDRISIKPYRKIKEIRVFLDGKKTKSNNAN